MNPLSYLRIGGGVLGAIALAALAWLVADRFHQKELADAAKACAVAVGRPDGDLLPCLPEIEQAAESARRAAACDASLLPSLRPETRFAMLNSCPSGVKRLVAQADAAEVRAADLATQIDMAAARERAAVSRAEARATRSTERNSHAAKALAEAPRDAGGNITCDAACLRRIGN